MQEPGHAENSERGTASALTERMCFAGARSPLAIKTLVQEMRNAARSCTLASANGARRSCVPAAYRMSSRRVRYGIDP
jgi:hypothetical protein